MTESLTKHERNLAAFIHASTFSKYFIPFGNFIFPLILWSANKQKHDFIDYNGKQALNFQISILLYSILISLLSIPFFIGFLPDFFDGNFLNINRFNNLDIHISSDDFRFGRWLWPAGITGVLQAGLVIVNIVYSILATIRTNEGQDFKYPFTINFIK